jgi:hypothetical protein
MKKIRGGAWWTVIGLFCATTLSAQFGTFGAMGMGVMQRQMEPQRLEFRPWVMANAMYWDNLAVAQTQDSSDPRSGGIYGGMLGWGVSGGKSLERSAIAMSYFGAARYISSRDGLGALTNTGNFAYFKQFSREWSLSTSAYGGASAGSYGISGGFGGLGGLGFNGFGLTSAFSPGGIAQFSSSSDNGLVEEEIFDNRVYFGGTRTTLVYSPNYRSQIGGGVLGVTSQRTAPGLFDLNGAGAFGQATYLLDRTTSITGGYTYTRIWYPGVIRDTGLHTMMGGISKSLARRTMLSAGGGYSRYNATGATQVQLDPLVAELLGTDTTIEIRSVKRNIVGFGASVSHVITDRISVSGRFNRGVSPGNGVLLASVRDIGGVTLGYAADAGWTFSFGLFASRSNGILQPDKDFQNVQGAAHASVRVFGDFRATFGGGYRWMRLPNQVQQRQAFATAGIMWSPGGGPLRWF